MDKRRVLWIRNYLRVEYKIIICMGHGMNRVHVEEHVEPRVA